MGGSIVKTIPEQTRAFHTRCIICPQISHGVHLVIDCGRTCLSRALVPRCDGQGKKGNPREAHDALKTRASLQSQYNQYAAFATAVSVALEALARPFPD
jgi:hypothetical protein